MSWTVVPRPYWLRCCYGEAERRRPVDRAHGFSREFHILFPGNYPEPVNPRGPDDRGRNCGIPEKRSQGSPADIDKDRGFRIRRRDPTGPGNTFTEQAKCRLLFQYHLLGFSPE